MRWPRALPRRDLAIAVVVTTLAQVELVLVTGQPPISWTVSNLVLLPALALRRVQPLLAVVVAAAGFVVPVSPPQLAVAVPFLVLLVLLASLGWHASLRHGLIGTGAVLTAGFGRQILTGTVSAADAAVNGVIIVGAWAAAFLVRRAQDRRVAAEVRADRAARQAVEAERARIARDLHDSMGHALTLITLQAGGTRERAGDADTRVLLGSIERTARSALTDLGRLLRLSGHEGDEALGVAALPDLVAEVRRSGPVVDLRVDVPESLPDTLSTTIYRIVQESLTNVVRHSTAARAEVTVDGAADGNVVVCVTDAGPARSATATGSGRGVAGLRERIRLLGGELECGPTGDGWQLLARLPGTPE